MSQGSKLEEDLRVLSYEPSYSSAVLCTTLNLVEDSFRPEYTHQCLPEESYRGHCPLESALQEKNHSLHRSEAYLHKSHRLQALATYFLDVQIHLAPSCRKCQVVVYQAPIKDETSAAVEPPSKKPKLVEPLTKAEIQDSIAKALPRICDEDCRDDFLAEPIGSVFTEYSCRSKGKGPEDFVITLAHGPSIADYHAEVQRLALWFIENADDVDVADDQSGFWKVLYLFQKHQAPENSSKYSLVGYMTLFHFNAPFHKPTPGIILRVCQALVFPPFQGQGHGSKLMQCVYDMAHGKYNGVCYVDNPTFVQVNVEDPSPGFTMLRNTFDYRFLTRLDRLAWWPAESMASTLVSSNSHDAAELLNEKEAFTALSDNDAMLVSSKAKITPRQVQLVNELLHLRWLLASGKPNEELEKRFRLMVKKRLNRENREDMSNYPSKEEKKAHLAQLYEEEVRPYKAWFQKQQSWNRKEDSSIENVRPREKGGVWPACKQDK